jgi:uncharacterized protein YjiS (DUF1127 family)
MDSSRRWVDSFRQRSASRDGGGLRAVPSLTSRRTATASGDCDRARTRRLFWGTRFWRWCARCAARSRERQALMQLDDRDLKDMGMTREQAKAEAAKPFWK